MSRKNTVGMWAVGLGMIALFVGSIYGVGQLLGTFWHASTEVTCDGKPMMRYDKCDSVYADGSHTGMSYTYDQKLNDQQFSHNVWLYGASFLIVVAVITVVGVAISMRNSNKPKATPKTE